MIDKKIAATEDLAGRYAKGILSSLDRIEAAIFQAYKSGGFSPEVIDAQMVREHIKEIMADAGFYENTDAMFGDGYQALLKNNAAFMREKFGSSLQYQKQSLERLNSIRALDLDKWDSLGDTAAREMERIIVSAQFGGIAAGDFKTQLESVIDDTMRSRTESLINTAFMSFDRVAGSTLAIDGGADQFEYVGPADSLTRPFCDEHIGEVKTWEEWQAINNDGGYPCTIYGGGVNCRHQLVPVVPEDKNAG